MKIYIKYMVSNRCKREVGSELDKMGVEHSIVELGEVSLKKLLNADQKKELENRLKKSGLELSNDKKSILFEKVKHFVVEYIDSLKDDKKMLFSKLLSQSLHQGYDYLSGLFSEIAGCTLEHYIILSKIERVKELLLYDELNLSEISYRLGYSSVAHLSGQFKKITGLTPTYFKRIKDFRKRINQEDLCKS